MDLVNIIGVIAGLLTTASFLPQAIKIIKTKDTKGISLEMYIIFVSGVALWLTYGILASQFPVIIANGITLALSSIILIMKFKYR
ncbi:MAG TPA: SemiSWEET transporter [Spirochaetota bacterium]|nr:SemiSWEET transporter [Spirochaetota bacterium]